jgi:hypothetical protein
LTRRASGRPSAKYARMLFAGLAMLSAALMDYSALERHLFSNH